MYCLDLVELVPPLLDCPVHGALEPRLQMVQSFPQVSLIWNRQFCAVGGGRGPQVCHKVRDGHIRFVSHGGNHRNF